jgi:hypothetical protein
MKNLLIKINGFLLKVNIVWFILIIVAFQLSISIILAFVLHAIFKSNYTSRYNYFLQLPFWLQLIILLPDAFIETILYQWFVIKILSLIKYLREHIIIIVIISAFLFGISHFDSVVHQFIAFTVGLILAYSFLISEEKKFSPVLIVSIIHCLHDFILISIIYLFR